MRELENVVLTLQAKQPFGSSGDPVVNPLSLGGQGQKADPGFLYLIEQIEARITGTVDSAVAKAVNKVRVRQLASRQIDN